MRKTRSFIILWCITFPLGLFCQDVEFKTANFKEDKEGLKNALAEIKAGDEYLHAGNEAIALVKDPGLLFKKALSHYLKANDFNSDNAALNMKIGNCYLYTSDKAKAPYYLKKALQLNPETGSMLHFLLGRAYQLNNAFEKAIQEYSVFEQTAKNKYIEEYKKLTSKYKKECKTAEGITKKKLRVWVDNCKNINSEQDEMAPCISADGQYMIFSSTRPNQHTPNELGLYDADIYQTHLKGKTWASPENTGQPLSTPEDEQASALSYDGQRLLLFKVKNGNADVYESQLNGLEWMPPRLKMSHIANTEYNETYACYEPLDIKIHYIFDGGKGHDRDIYFSGLMDAKNNIWGKGQSISHEINTSFHEGSVYMHPDGQTMFFSSQGHNSIGGYDIFKVTRDPNTQQWSNPVNLGYPINTPYDELFYVETANGKYAYISSNRKGGKGGFDIYKITYWGPEKQLIVDNEDFLLASIAQPVKDHVIASKVKVERKSLTVFKGKVIDHLTGKPVKAKLEMVDNATGKLIASFYSNKASGKFLLSLPSGRNYGIAVQAEGYLFHSENFDIPKGSPFDLVDKTIELKNIAIGSKIALRNVFFATDQSSITPESYPELNRLVALLREVPSLKIELSGHTDNVGNEEHNIQLSKARADAVKTYLIRKGIEASRLTAKGYGSTRPIAPNNTAAGRQLNRRTEFEITAN